MKHLVAGFCKVRVWNVDEGVVVFVFSDLKKLTPEQVVLGELKRVLWLNYFFARLLGKAKLVSVLDIRVDNVNDLLYVKEAKKL